MKDIPAIILTVFLVLSAQMANTQQLVTYRSESVSCVDGQYQTRETPVVPGSFKLFAAEGREISPKAWKIQPRDGIVVLADSICDLPLYCSYRIFYYQQPQISEYPWLQNPNTTDTTSGVSNKPMGYNPADLRNNAGSNEGKLRTRGSIARGVNAGNRQNAVLNSNLNLQVEGDLSDNLKVRASLTDRNIPIQPDGTNQKLQEFDKVFIEVYNNDFSMLAGDIQLKQNEDYFMRYAKKARGALLSGKLNTENIDIESDLGVSISRGNYHRQEITGQEGNQGPYKLRGANNESYIIVISGSERIYVDGELMIRGQSQDYIIDYNTGELTFTANRLITKDSRIIAESEYRAASYNRMMLATNHDIKTKNSRYYIRYYNASDGKNQPLDQRLDMQQRSFLSSIGDDLSSALYPAWDSTGFEQSQVRYRITDTTVNGQVYDSVFVYSTNPDSAVYQVGFTEVGENMGNYMRLNSAANGRVFQWVAPKNGVPAGNYAPVTQLITPKKHQMLSLGAEHQVSDQTEVFYQMSFSDRDINTYSDRDGQNDQGIAFHGGVNQYLLKDSTHNLRLGVAYDFIQRNFSVLERFRESEFKRNWNVDNELAA
ncbi:MAG TPA: hypothetical protein VJ946_02100, partial [Bacteroidales bacterium]|nr:hypothetical protein [Bacteroidales bacterium]